MENEEQEVLDCWELADKDFGKQIKAKLKKEQMRLMTAEQEQHETFSQQSAGTNKGAGGSQVSGSSTGQPKIQIMKRPSGQPLHPSASAGNLGKSAAATKKTLEEREAAYAEARLRIFGNNNGTAEEVIPQPTASPNSAAQQISTTPKIMARNQSFTDFNK